MEPNKEIVNDVNSYLRGVESSTCLLLPTTPSPTPMLCSETLSDQNVSLKYLDSPANNGIEDAEIIKDGLVDDSSSSAGSVVQDPVSAQLINNISMLDYQTLSKTGDIDRQEDDIKMNHGGNPNGKKLPAFVNWNWNVIRKVLLWIVLSSLFACIAIVIAVMVMLPKSCMPHLPWYQGKVFYEIFPASFEDSNGDGIGDLKGINSKIGYIHSVGFGAVRLNSIFEASQYPERYFEVKNLMEIDKNIGTEQDFLYLVRGLHEKNIYLVLDLPIYPFISNFTIAMDKQVGERIKNQSMSSVQRNQTNSLISHLAPTDIVIAALRYWSSLGVDGFYLKGLEYLTSDPLFDENFIAWTNNLMEGKILIVSEDSIFKANDKTQNLILSKVQLIDIHIDVQNDVQNIREQISEKSLSKLLSKQSSPWIHWNVGNINSKRLASKVNINTSLASLMLVMILPGTPSIFYGDEIGLNGLTEIEQDFHESVHIHNLVPMKWKNESKKFKQNVLPWILDANDGSVSFDNVEIISKCMKLRYEAPTVYLNGVYKDGKLIVNNQVRTKNDILVVDRWYPRRDSYAFISNFGSITVVTDLSYMFYGGLVLTSSDSSVVGKNMLFKQVSLYPGMALVIKLEK